MTHLEILQWTMGWAWPIMLGLGVLLTWGIERFMTWTDDQDLPEEQPTGTMIDGHCVCQGDQLRERSSG